MKAVFAALNTLVVALVFEIDRLSVLLEGPMEGTGTSIGLFFNIVKIGDNIPWAQVPEFVFAMKTIMMFVIVVDLIFVVVEYKKSRKRLAEAGLEKK